MSRQIPTQSNTKYADAADSMFKLMLTDPPTAHLLAPGCMHSHELGMLCLQPRDGALQLSHARRTGLVISGSGPSGGACELPGFQV